MSLIRFITANNSWTIRHLSSWRRCTSGSHGALWCGSSGAYQTTTAVNSCLSYASTGWHGTTTICWSCDFLGLLLLVLLLLSWGCNRRFCILLEIRIWNLLILLLFFIWNWNLILRCLWLRNCFTLRLLLLRLFRLVNGCLLNWILRHHDLLLLLFSFITNLLLHYIHLFFHLFLPLVMHFFLIVHFFNNLPVNINIHLFLLINKLCFLLLLLITILLFLLSLRWSARI